MHSVEEGFVYKRSCFQSSSAIDFRCSVYSTIDDISDVAIDNIHVATSIRKINCVQTEKSEYTNSSIDRHTYAHRHVPTNQRRMKIRFVLRPF